MTAHSPLPTLDRAFSVLLVALLVGSVVAPIAAAEPAAAQSETGGDSCMYGQMGLDWFVLDCGSESPSEVGDHDDGAMIQQELHAHARDEYEDAEAFLTVGENYGEDTTTLASLEARNAIAAAYENGSSPSAADAAAQSAIQDYYTKRQMNVLEASSSQSAQLSYIGNVSHSNPDVYNEFLYPVFGEDTGKRQAQYDDFQYTIDHGTGNVTGNLQTLSYTLANGSSHEYETIEVDVAVHPQETDSPYTGQAAMNLSSYDSSDEMINLVVDDGADYQDHADTTGVINVRPSYVDTTYSIDDGHPGQAIADYSQWAALLEKFEKQSETVSSNYQSGTAQDLYDAMDAGKIDPSDVRGAEGQVRFMSGDSNVTEERFKVALLSSLSLSNPGFNTTMAVQYDGYTDASWNTSTDGSREVVYSNKVNQTYEGLMFSGETPSNGFDKGATYNTENLDGTTLIHTQNNGTVTFEKGTFTVKGLYDQNGNEQQNVSWEEPKYGSYNADEFVQYMNESKQMQQELIDSMEDEDDSSGSIPKGLLPDLNGNSSALAGLVILVGCVIVVIAVVIRS